MPVGFFHFGDANGSSFGLLAHGSAVVERCSRVGSPTLACAPYSAIRVV